MSTSSVIVPPTDESLKARAVVAVAVQWRGRIGLFRRSGAVAHDRGRWHCITGYTDADSPPEHQALLELHEETGLRVADLDSFEAGAVISPADGAGMVWTVHTYRAATQRRRLQLNHEHDAYRWVRPRNVAQFNNRVEWLDAVLIGSGALLNHQPQGSSSGLQATEHGRSARARTPSGSQTVPSVLQDVLRSANTTSRESST